ncbi:helix-turn-helix domain-containing protein [Pseudoduganella sp. CY13W]|uniref:Helix-turn-helix domain-containing protein n=1 Tax=Duganella qianjiadongensis TaxID=2692176 RepID=A0ABW9VR15_9BURK|nr:helix-turn-helix domain-containing protein [Duganella qianjiadongensis]
MSKHYSLSYSQLRRWVNLFQTHGEAGLERKSASYSAAQKLAIQQHM